VSSQQRHPSRIGFHGSAPLQSFFDASVPLSLDMSARSISPRAPRTEHQYPDRRVQAERVFLQRTTSPSGGHLLPVGSVTVSPHTSSAKNLRCSSPTASSVGLKMCWQPGDATQATMRNEAAVLRRCA
jgi:hypothetical protein